CARDAFYYSNFDYW
nr:immunoglobulin heavy chain junction region [Mus musculus]MBK4187213.1 immunoglobulin heavy chain junction region [Mus musculus]